MHINRNLQRKNLIISCLYRAPGSNIEVFKDWMEDIFSNKGNKTIFICGDFNIDLLNPNKHKMTEEFINTMYSMSYYPIITRPSRITSHCATLIDNIFTNDIENNTLSRPLINDISDHLPVFTVYDRNYKNNKPVKNKEYRRVRSEESMIAFMCNELQTQNWNEMYEKIGINSAYQGFLRIFKTL